jgi:putative tryptophan/tyrosine transport system substrate-binding protein
MSGQGWMAQSRLTQLRHWRISRCSSEVGFSPFRNANLRGYDGILSLGAGMRRRGFLKFLAGSAAAWPFAAHAQQPGKVPRIGVLIALAQSDSEARAWVGGFLQGLEKRGWSEERNLHIDYRFAPADAQAQVLAKELVSLQPDVIFAMPTPAVAALNERPIRYQSCSLLSPIRSAQASLQACRDRVVTSPMQYEPSVNGKWLSMLKDIAPRLARVAFVINPKTAPFYNN